MIIIIIIFLAALDEQTTTGDYTGKISPAYNSVQTQGRLLCLLDV